MLAWDDLPAAALLLKSCELSVEGIQNLGLICFERDEWERIASECVKAGVPDWALVLAPIHQMQEESWVGEELLQQCGSQGALGAALQRALKHHVAERAAPRRLWALVRGLGRYCRDGSLLLAALTQAVQSAHLRTVSALVQRVHLTNIPLMDLLEMSADSEVRVELVKIWIGAGISTFERRALRELIGRQMIADCINRELNNCTKDTVSIFLMMIKSGVFPNDLLFELTNWIPILPVEVPELKSCFKMMRKAATRPERLEHLARMAVSHLLGVRPGRGARLDALPLARPHRDLLRFRDVLAAQNMTSDDEDGDDDDDEDDDDDGGEVGGASSDDDINDVEEDAGDVPSDDDEDTDDEFE